jgi:pilus assembly protein Flp/PilA
MKNLVTRFVKDQSGATAVEYVLLAAMIALAIIVGMQSLASKLNAEFTIIGNDL